MEKVGMRRKSKKEQARDAELGLIIDEMGKAMWDANKSFIANYRRSCDHAERYGLTPRMDTVWWQYVDFCQRHSNDK